MQHGRPEQGVEIEDVFADEVVHLGLAVGFEVFVEIDADAVAQVLERRHVAHGRVQPHVEIFARRVGDFETEIRRVAADVPVGQGGFFALARADPFILLSASGLQMGRVRRAGCRRKSIALRKSPQSPGFLKKKCSDSRNHGRWRRIRRNTGLISSVGAYVVPHTSQLSPYWSWAWHFGHSPFTKRSGRNICFSGSKRCADAFCSTILPLAFSAAVDVLGKAA